MALALEAAPGVYALTGDTDGVDGAADVAGAIISPDTLARAEKLGLKARLMLDRNDAHTFFAQLGDAVVTGPTRTNVNDFRAVLVTGATDHERRRCRLGDPDDGRDGPCR